MPDLRLFILILLCYQRAAFVAVPLNSPTQHLATRITMATHGFVVQFDPEKEEWTSYVERLNYYLIANEVTEDAKKCAILMSCCGPTTYKTIRSLVDSETRKTIKYPELIDLLTSHYNPKPSSILQRFKFYNRNRSKEESIASYVAALRALAEYCEYITRNCCTNRGNPYIL